MSTFNGTINEIPSIAVDNFEKIGIQFYFLSHCHADHLKGIEKLNGDSLLYATPISALIIRKKYPKINIRELEIGVINNIEVTGDDGKVMKVGVQSLSAGHCMGACMLLFQIEGTDILYTGDFRISLDNAKRIKPLQEIIDYGNLVLYLDSTFMKEKFQKFPKINDSIEKTIEIADNHLKANSSHRVHLVGSARYGYERLFIELSQRLKQKFFCVEEDVYEQYSQITEISKHVTKNHYEARVFVKPKFLGQHKSERNVLSINLSAYYWEKWEEESPLVHKIEDDYFRICYATHNSLEEIEDFIKYLKPKKVYLNVVPNNTREKIEMLKKLKDIQRSYMPLSDSEDDEQNQRKLTKKLSFKRLRSNDQINISSKKFKS